MLLPIGVKGGAQAPLMVLGETTPLNERRTNCLSMLSAC